MARRDQVKKIQTVRDAMQAKVDADAAMIAKDEARMARRREIRAALKAKRDARAAQGKKNPSAFGKGTGCYTCACCQKKTRSTGRGDNENVGLCAGCFDLASLDNHHRDNCSSHVAEQNDVVSCPECGPEARALIAAGAGSEGDARALAMYEANAEHIVAAETKAPSKPKVAALRALVAALDSGDAEKVAVALANAKAVLK
jgi:hypothetical protein